MPQKIIKTHQSICVEKKLQLGLILITEKKLCWGNDSVESKKTENSLSLNGELPTKLFIINSVLNYKWKKKQRRKKGGGFFHLLQLKNPHLMFKTKNGKYFWRHKRGGECVSIRTFSASAPVIKSDSALNFLLACESCQRLQTNEVEN